MARAAVTPSAVMESMPDSTAQAAGVSKIIQRNNAMNRSRQYKDRREQWLDSI
jgi:hypothetical protein